MKKNGYTFVEIMIVLAIGLLMTLMVIVAFGKSAERAKSKMCRGNIKMLYYAGVQYALDHGVEYGSQISFDDLKNKYFEGATLPTCPNDGSSFQSTYIYGEVPVCPSGSHSWSATDEVGL